MRSESTQSGTIRQYLLGQLSPEELTQLEERLLADGAFYEELLIEEDELIDQFLRGELSVPEGEYFQSHFLRAQERQRKLSFASALKKFVTLDVAGKEQDQASVADLPADDSRGAEPSSRWRLFSVLHIQSPVMGFALAAAVLVILFGSSWIIVRNLIQSQPPDILTQVLTPSQTTRGDDHTETTKFSIPSGKDTVRLQLQLVADDYQVYRAVLQDAAGAVIVQQNDLQAQPVSGRSAVVLDVPARNLPAGNYQVKLKGVNSGGREENAGSYQFLVSR